MKSKEVTRIGAIASKCCSGNIHVVVHRSWIRKRVFCILKSRQQERKNTHMVGNLASALIDGGSVSVSVSQQQRQRQ